MSACVIGICKVVKRLVLAVKPGEELVVGCESRVDTPKRYAPQIGVGFRKAFRAMNISVADGSR